MWSYVHYIDIVRQKEYNINVRFCIVLLIMCISWNVSDDEGKCMNEYLTIKEIAEKWDVTTRRVQKMCADGKIPGASKFGRDWAIPKDAEKPSDGRVTTGEYKDWRKQLVNSGDE